MDWNQLFLKKEEWQRQTFIDIKQALISAKDNRFLNYENAEENHLVMIYGKSQVGKTTIILNMIGLKDEYFQEVYDTLRAGVPKGNSSTSTAIIYGKSPKHEYGCSLTDITTISERKVAYFDTDSMKKRLADIREDVENNRILPGSILYIYIPCHYFLEDPNINSISIMDMPGIESRNHKEDLHVQNLMTTYIPISSVCIIACRSNDIQSLETTVLPNEIPWKEMSHRFVLVITHAFNDANTKNYFRISSDREQDFYTYVKETYTQEIRNILGKSNQTDVFPIDVGDTLERLCNEEIANESDRTEIQECKNRILSDLRQSIANRKGERLKAALSDLHSVIERYGTDEIQQIEKNIYDYENRINRRENRIGKIKASLKELPEEFRERENELKKIDPVLAQIYGISPDFMDTKNYILESILMVMEEENSLVNNLKDFIPLANRNREKKIQEKILEHLRGKIQSKTAEFIKILANLVDKAELHYDLAASAIQKETDDACLRVWNENVEYISSNIVVDVLGELLFPIAIIKDKKKTKKMDMFLEDLDIVCEKINIAVNQVLSKYVESCRQKIKSKYDKLLSEIKQLDRHMFLQEEKIKRYFSEKDAYRREITFLNRQKQDIEQKRRQDQETLDQYLQYAENAYQKQRRQIIQEINQSRSADDKMLWILLLGLLDKDYQKVTGGIRENNHQYALAK